MNEEKSKELRMIKFNPTTLKWLNFAEEQPEVDQWIIIWAKMGKLAPNFYISYRDGMGNYDIPLSNKKIQAIAWAYLDCPKEYEI